MTFLGEEINNFMFLSSFYGKPRAKFRVILKSGADFFLTAESVKYKWDKESCQLTEYNFEKPRGEVPLHCSPLEIATIIEIV